MVVTTCCLLMSRQWRVTSVADNVLTTDVVDRILAMVPAPTPVWNDQTRQQRHQQHGYQPGHA